MLFLADSDAAENVGVARQVLGGAVDGDVDSRGQRPEDGGGGEGAVYDYQCAVGVGDSGQRGNIVPESLMG